LNFTGGDSQAILAGPGTGVTPPRLSRGLFQQSRGLPAV
jgi:hypothetical protein